MSNNCTNCKHLGVVCDELSLQVGKLAKLVEELRMKIKMSHQTPSAQSDPGNAAKARKYPRMESSPRLTRSKNKPENKSTSNNEVIIATQSPNAIVKPVSADNSDNIILLPEISTLATSLPSTSALSIVSTSSSLSKTGTTEKTVIGGTTDVFLTAAPKRVWIFITNMSIATSSEDIIKFVLAKFKIKLEPSHCVRLTKANVDVATLDYVSFRVRIMGDVESDVLNASNWPSGVHVRKFKPTKNVKRSAVNLIT